MSIGLTGTIIHRSIELPLHQYMEHIHLYLISIPVGQLLPKETPGAATQSEEHFSPEVADSSITTMASLQQLEKI